MKRTVKLIGTGIMVFLFVGWTSFSSVTGPKGDKKPWNAPANFKSMKNPVSSDAASLATGKELYMKHCKSCHGAKGLGDGPKAAELETSSGDFSLADFQSQSDGELFYKTKEGRDDMPSYKKKIAEDQNIWLLVNYMRTFAKK